MKNLKTNRHAVSTTIIAVVVIAIIVAVGIGAYLAMQTPPEQSPPDSSSPTPTVAPTTPGTQGVAGANSLRYSVTVTENGVLQGSYTYFGKNAGTNNFMMRVEYTDSEGQVIYIFNQAQQKAWTYSDGEWVDLSAFYSVQFDVWNSLWQGYVTSLAGWAGTGDHTYSAEGTTVRIYDVLVNVALTDSLFEPN